jgi:hypothetical protein
MEEDLVIARDRVIGNPTIAMIAGDCQTIQIGKSRAFTTEDTKEH